MCWALRRTIWRDCSIHKVAWGSSWVNIPWTLLSNMILWQTNSWTLYNVHAQPIKFFFSDESSKSLDREQTGSMCALSYLLSSGFRSCVRDLIWDFLSLSRKQHWSYRKMKRKCDETIIWGFRCGRELQNTPVRIVKKVMWTQLDEIPSPMDFSAMINDSGENIGCFYFTSRQNRLKNVMKNW